MPACLDMILLLSQWPRMATVKTHFSDWSEKMFYNLIIFGWYSVKEHFGLN